MCRLTISLGSESAVSDVVKRDPDPRFEFGAFFKLNAQHFAEAEEAGVVAQVHDEKGEFGHLAVDEISTSESPKR